MEHPTTRFRQQMDRLPETIRNANVTHPQLLSTAVHSAGKELVVAVGSGGSLITCEFLRMCRAHALGAETVCMTPLTWITRSRLMNAPAPPLWLFSAGGNNQDILSTAQAAMRMGCQRLDLLTASSASPLADTIQQHSEGFVHALTGLAEKDAFLAVHSLIGSCLAILQGFPPWQQKEVYQYHLFHLADALEPEYRCKRTNQIDVLFDRPNWLVLFDPLLTPAAIAMETSCHELGLASVQLSDFRNFAHGRHVGLSRMQRSTAVIALVTQQTKAIWEAIRALLPVEVPSIMLHFDKPLPWAALHAFGEILTILEQVSEHQNLDAAKPGVPDFGKAIYAEPSVLELTRNMDAPWKRKARGSTVRWPNRRWVAAEQAFRHSLRQTVFRGLLLDFDGTVVPNPQQEAEPWVREWFSTLLDNGSLLGIASGRGGSLTDALRLLVPEQYQDQVLVGYYNGGLILPLSETFNRSAIPLSQALHDVEAAISRDEHIKGLIKDTKPGPLQYVLSPQAGISPNMLADEVSALVNRLNLNSEARILYSDHSVDICPMASSKQNVLEAMMSNRQENSTNAILCIGDKGSKGGNDWELLGNPFGLSVADVCERPEACWNLLPTGLSGPDGLHYYSQCIRWVGSGYFLFDPL